MAKLCYRTLQWLTRKTPARKIVMGAYLTTNAYVNIRKTPFSDIEYPLASGPAFSLTPDHRLEFILGVLLVVWGVSSYLRASSRNLSVSIPFGM